MAFSSVNPATGEALRSHAALGDSELESKLAIAARAFREHRSGDMQQREAAMRRAADLLEREKRTYARLMVEEMGKPIAAAVAEVEKSARGCRHYAQHASEYLADEPLPADGAESFLRYLPLGPVLAVMPWNFPFWQVFRFAAPALMAGNVGLLKHAHNVPGCALAIEDVFRRAGFPDGVFQTLLVGTEQVQKVIEDPRVAAVTITGSAGAGRKVAGAAGAVLKPSVLELGGSDPFIVMPSADLDAAARTAVTARNLNNGQSCIAAKRFLVHRDVYRAFEERFVAGVKRLRVGDPMREDVDVGPLATRQGLETVEAQVKRSIELGARCLCGGARLEGRGFFFQPSVLARVPHQAPAWTEELFGPVAVLEEVRGVDEAIALANDTEYGLGSSVWTRDEAETARFIEGLEAGMTFVNAMVVSDPRLPFGGVKHSGYGRELGALGIRAFTNAKTVVVQRGEAGSSSKTE